MKNLLKRHIGKIFLITILSILTWIITLTCTKYNPYIFFISLYYPGKYMVKDIFIIEEHYSWSGSNISDTDALDYSFYGYLLNKNKIEYDLRWGRQDEVPWEIVEDTILNGANKKFIRVFRGKLQESTIYPINDKNYISSKLSDNLLSCIFFSIPFLTVPFFIYLFYLGYLERKQEKKETKNNTFRNNIYDPFQ